MNRSRCLYCICFYTVLALTTLVAVGGTVAFWTAFDAEIGYIGGSPLTVVCNAAALLAAGVAIILPMFIPAKTLPTAWPVSHGITGYLFQGLPAVALLVFAVLSAGISSPSMSTFSLSAASLWLAPGAAAYFVVSAIPAVRKKPLALAVVGILPILWALLCIADTYTDWVVAINSPIKLCIQFGCAGIMLMMTAEQRYRLGKAAPRLALCLYGLTILLSLGAGIPLTLISTKDVATLRYALCLFAVGLYAVKRMADFTAALPSASTDEQEA